MSVRITQIAVEVFRDYDGATECNVFASQIAVEVFRDDGPDEFPNIIADPDSLAKNINRMMAF